MPGHAVSVKTEYQRSFRPDLFVCSTTTYRNNRAFRRDQRNRFQGHAHDPFIWQDDDNGSDENLDVFSGDECSPRTDDENETCRGGGHSEAGVDRRRPAFVSDHQFKHELWNRLYEKRQRRLVGQKASQTDADVSPDRQERGDEEEREAESRGVNSDDETSVVHVVNAGGAHKQTQTPEYWYTNEKSPFAPYGYQNDEKETGAKKTYNVKAAKEIFPSALRAKRLRDAGCCRSSTCIDHDGRDSALTRGRATRSMPLVTRSDSRCTQEMERRGGAVWQTEYEREYQPYELSRYQDPRHERAVRVSSPDLQPSIPHRHRSYISIG